jgi:hypothetical protein
VPVDQELTGGPFDGVIPAAVNRVEAQQVRTGRRIAGDFVDLNELDVRPVPGGTEGQPANTPKAVDANPKRSHGCNDTYRFNG